MVRVPALSRVQGAGSDLVFSRIREWVSMIVRKNPAKNTTLTFKHPEGSYKNSNKSYPYSRNSFERRISENGVTRSYMDHPGEYRQYLTDFLAQEIGYIPENA